MRVQALNEGGAAQPVAARRAILVPNDRNQEPGYGARLDIGRVAGRVTGIHLSPDRARVPRVLPCSANGVSADHLWIGVYLVRVGAEVVGGELIILIIEECRLGCEEQ